MGTALPEFLAHYRIVSLLGEGGMGEVYLADDERLGRRVAIKVLPDTGEDSEAKRRMLREARAVAMLDHPNVCTIYEVGEHEGRPFIVMQYIEGQTLFDRLQQTPLTLAEVVEIGSQLAAALDEAHSHGIIHRDIKSLNIMLTHRGQVKVLDFGLAKVENAAGTTVTDMMTSMPGVITGTAPYMSPEQLRGSPLDGRSDIFSAGVVLYEMATGHRPFDRENAVSTITAILFEEPPPFDDPEIAPLAPVIRRALAKEPSKRYPTAAMLQQALQQLLQRPRVRRRRTRSSPEMEATQITPTPAAAAPASRPKSAARIDSLAVLPLSAEKTDPGTEYLLFGLCEGVVGALGPVRRLRVLAPTTVARYAGTNVDPQQAGRELKVAGIVGVRARVEADQLHADVVLISTATGSRVWSSQYSKSLRDIAELAETIASDIAEQVRMGTTSSQRKVTKAPKRKRAVDPEAEQLFLKGRFQWVKRDPEAVKQAMGYFQGAVEQDPSFARAWAGLADGFLSLGFMQALPQRDVLPKGKAAAARAIELDPSLADPHATMGYAHGLFEWDWDAAHRELEEAMRLNPNYPWAPHWLGLIMCGRGKTRRGLELIELARTLDPLSPIIAVAAGIAYLVARKYDAAIGQCWSVLETAPSFIPGYYYLGIAYDLRGDYDEAVRNMERTVELAGPAPLYLGALAYSYARGSRRNAAERIVEQLREQSKHRYVTPYAFTMAYTGLERLDEAFTWFETSVEERNAWLWYLPVEPRLDILRKDPRFAAIVEKAGVPSWTEPEELESG